jgi:predicted dehydrogenase
VIARSIAVSGPTDPTRRTFLTAAGSTVLVSTIMQAKDDPPLAPPDKQSANAKLPDPPQKPAGYAIVGLGQLALEEVMPAFALCKRSRPVALVSGHPDKAKKVAAAYGMDPRNIYSYKSYDTLKDNPAVDVIYVILPNSMHAEYTIRGLKAGKHVLCEKPMAASVNECEQMISASKAAKRKLMIAYRLRYEPFNTKAIELCRGGEIGKLKSITASHCQNVDAPNIRLSRELAGGPVEDVGIYCLNACRYLTGEEPLEVTAVAHQPKDDPRFREVPESVLWTLRFPSGVVANCDCSFGTVKSARYRVLGDKGHLEVDPAFTYFGLEMNVAKDGWKAEFQMKEANHFTAEMDHFSGCVLDGKDPRTPGEEGLADMRVIAAITEAARTGNAVKIGRG